ncbi:hypothetical protein ThidrDRAFT_0478 [Thiorhodococcus drewsii AZ1]|uniref:Uncharacterized protein n=1 Tax=Thiorhodococcus drewsii AZ1 TaxID=765913 RepID=G2DW69_9GAMM|nr:hypothetical protein [Thiorhodococcus drewsii]EGV33789.1 hypothetical protein ThidrDRAFT_0478 [Thiorhodococcus drewsii AZ1]
MQDLELILKGPGTEEALAALKAVLADTEATLTSTPVTEGDSLPDKAIDPVAVATLVVTIPSAVLAVRDMAERIVKRRRAKDLIATAGRLRIERRVEILTVTLEGPQALADMDPDLVLDLIEQDREAGSS